MNFKRQNDCPSDSYWTIRKGDTLYRIAQTIDTTIPEILRLNPNINPTNLRIGQQICLPKEIPCPSGIYWRIAEGDTLYQITIETNTTVDELLDLNPNIDPQNLQIGQNICLPD
ncbi:MAG: LysM peptidoglycan-binding domain-containing protein [Bacillota bacterium]